MSNDVLFYDLSTHPYPEGSSTATRLALVAKRLGFTGICAMPHDSFFTGKERFPEGSSICRGVEIVAANANEMRRLIERNRRKVQVLAVHGGDETINRSACEDGRVDILTHPQEGKTSGINHIIARLAADRHVAIEFSMYPIIRLKGGSRVRTLSSYRTNFALARKYGAPYVITSGAMSHYDLRDPQSIIALCALFGMREEDAMKGLIDYPAEIVRRASPAYIMAGVELVDDRQSS